MGYLFDIVKVNGIHREDYVEEVLKNLSNDLIKTKFDLVSEYNLGLEAVLIYPKEGSLEVVNVEGYVMVDGTGVGENFVQFYDHSGNKIVINRTNYYNHD